MISEHMIGKIENALHVGMALEDAMVLAQLTPSQMAELAADEEMQLRFASIRRTHELSLLNSLHEIIDVQVRMGRESAVTWMLERVNPRYNTKTVQDEQQSIHLHFANEDPEGYDTVRVFSPSKEQ